MLKSWPATTPRFTESVQQLASARAIVGDIGSPCATTPKELTPAPSAWPKLKTASPFSIVSSASTERRS